MYKVAQTISGACFKMLFTSTIVSYFIAISPLTCIELPELQTSMVPTSQSGQVGVTIAATQHPGTSNTQVLTTQHGVQLSTEVASSRKPERTDERQERTSPASPVQTTTDRVSTNPSVHPPTERYQQDSSPVTLVKSFPGQTGGRLITLPAPISSEGTETTYNTTKRPVATGRLQISMKSTYNTPQPQDVTLPFQNRCFRYGVMVMNARKGTIAWYFDPDVCIIEQHWTLVSPDCYGFVFQFHHVEMELEDSLVITSFDKTDQTTWRKFTSKNIESLAPILLRKGEINIKLHTPAGDYRRWRNTNFNLSYRAYPRVSLPEFTRVYENPTETDFVYRCSEITNLPQAITCDGIRHCEHGEDEENCPYRAEGCGDWFPYNDQCLKVTFRRVLGLVSGQSHVTMPLQAERSCQSEYGATLASLPDSAGINIVTEMIRKSGFLNAVVGIHKVKPVSRRLRHLYRFLWQWGDRGSLIAYEQQKLQRSGTMVDCAILNVSVRPFLQPLECVLPDTIPHGYVCMRPNPNHSANKLQLSGVSFPRASASPDVFSIKECPDGSVVQTFHRCQWGPQDEDSNSGWSPNNLPLFKCRFGPAIHYSLLCDGKDDCADRSDELDCGKPQFSPLLDSSFICRNWQAIPAEKRCDGISDCFDESDEESCVSCGEQIMCVGVGCVPSGYSIFINTCPNVPPVSGPPFISYNPGNVKLDGYGTSILEYAGNECKEGFFSCRDGYCIPTFLLNNGEKDCRYGEDEDIPVHNMTCPGYYRCQGSGSCVHKNYVCDGIYHCPNKDDEMFCHMTCPRNQGCICEGHAYKCSEMIDPQQNLHVRYLDLSHASNVSLENIHYMEYLSFLNLSFCHLSNVTLTNMNQLQILDLSYNSLTELASLSLHKLSGLVYLDLSSNPFAKSLNYAFSTILKLGELQNLRILIMANVGLEAIDDKAFSPLSKLTYLDIRGNPVHSYDKRSLLGLTALEELHTDESKLCCSYFHSSLTQCHAPVDELSSCSDLLAQDFFRVFLWSFSVLAIVGNAGVLIYRLFVNTRTSPPAFRVLVKNLCASDLLMGVYMMMIGVADAYYRWVYVAKEGEWTNSTACTIAGFLSLVSSEVSAFVICLITLDRVLVLCFPLNSRLHLSSRVTISACCAVWVIGIVLAAVPLLAGMEFYGMNGICLPLPITRRQFSGQTYAFGVFIVLNFVLFVFIGVGQVCIYHAVRNASTVAGSARRMRDMTLARRLFLVVFTDLCCWFPIGIMGLLAVSGTPIPGEVNVWAAIFVLPLNSALNPFLYTLNGLMEQWKKRRMEQRTKRLIGKLHTEIPKWQPASVKELMKICVRSKIVEKETAMRWLGINVDSSTEMSTKEDMPNEGDTISTYDSRNPTQSTNFDVYDKADTPK